MELQPWDRRRCFKTHPKHRLWSYRRLTLPWDYFMFARQNEAAGAFERAPPPSVLPTLLTKGAPPKKH